MSCYHLEISLVSSSIRKEVVVVLLSPSLDLKKMKMLMVYFAMVYFNIILSVKIKSL